MNFKSYKNLIDDIKYKLLPKLPSDIGSVYGIPRSGLLPASIVATLLGANLAPVGGVLKMGARGSMTVKRGSKVLLLDDSIYGGAAMRNALALMSPGQDIITCAIYAHPKAINKVHIYAEELGGPRMFEWNFLGIKATEDYMFDMDGVICSDPAVYDDDGMKYGNEIAYGVKPLYLPQVKIHSICTNRIERWRPETIAWLERYNIRYDELIMQPYATAVERRKKSFTPEYKAQNFNNSTATVFVESHVSQAIEIAKRTHKPVLCIENMYLYNSGNQEHICLLNLDKAGVCQLCGKEV
jgi:uncharacterized HAD superfamily protein